MNTSQTLVAVPNIRVATSPTELPEQPRDFDFTGSADDLTEFLKTDMRQWDCIEYVVWLNPDSTNLWSVWRR